MTSTTGEEHPSSRLLTPPPEDRGLQLETNGATTSDANAQRVAQIPEKIPEDHVLEDSSLPLPSIERHLRDRAQTVPSHTPQQQHIHQEDGKNARRATDTPVDSMSSVRENVLKMTPAQIRELTTSPGSFPLRAESPFVEDGKESGFVTESDSNTQLGNGVDATQLKTRLVNGYFDREIPRSEKATQFLNSQGSRHDGRPKLSTRGLSEPFTPQKNFVDHERGTTSRKRVTVGSSRKYSNAKREESHDLASHRDEEPHSPSPSSLPLPPFSMPTYLQLELSSERPSPFYIYPSSSSELPYESSRVKFERLLNFLMLPPQLEQVLVFGTLTCLDAWLYMFTILPLRFLTSIWILIEWVTTNIANEVRFVIGYIYEGVGRLWRRRRAGVSPPSRPESENDTPNEKPKRERASSRADQFANTASSRKAVRRNTDPHKGHRRSRSVPSLLQPNHKADLLQGFLIIASCMVLMRFDASRMYHSIRGQAAIKLYVIYNVLEVCDRLFSALGQDILECLFSRETLERKPNGRSKIIRPFWLFLLALLYCVFHATALFYQVITLNVAVNSYSNALLTLLMSNQFVEIKGTVFKRIEKENLFQLTCADIVERFQLWLMLLIIALRNIVEVGGLSISLSSTFSGPFSSSGTAHAPTSSNTSSSSSSWFSQKAFGFMPNSFTIMPSLLPFQVLGPFLLVLGSEMLVDWVKHAYITKFNATSAKIYSRFFDVLAKDYYSHAFAEQTLTRRLGLPLIPLACLFIRATLQTYHMFLATNISPPLMSTATSLATHNSSADATASPALAQIDAILRRALGASTFGGASGPSSFLSMLQAWSIDDAIALATMLVVFLALYLLLLALKIVLGMLLLSWARTRYAGMKDRESATYVEPEAKRTGAWAAAQVGEARRSIIYEGDEEGLKRVRERESRARDVKAKGKELESVERYSMLSKRIW